MIYLGGRRWWNVNSLASKNSLMSLDILEVDGLDSVEQRGPSWPLDH